LPERRRSERQARVGALVAWVMRRPPTQIALLLTLDSIPHRENPPNWLAVWENLVPRRSAG
jgi:hypothetical protein